MKEESETREPVAYTKFRTLSSGIPNNAFYRIAESIGRNKADSIFFHALTTGKIFRYSLFIDLRLGISQASSELFPGNTAFLDAIADAYDAVEIYDGTGTPEEEIWDAPTSEQWIIALDWQTGRVAKYETSGTFMHFVSSEPSMTKPSIPDSGDFVYFIDTTFNVRMARSDGTEEVAIGNPEIAFSNIGISPDGNKLAYVLEWNDTLFVHNFLDTTGFPVETFPLYTPTYDGLSRLNNVLYPDVIEWDIEGERIICDCLNFLSRDTDSLFYWDIFMIDYESGLVSRALPSVQTGDNDIGFPTWGKIHPNLIAFDHYREDDTVMTYMADLAHNTFAPITSNGIWWGSPSFAPDDESVIFQFENALGVLDIWRVGIEPENLSTDGNFEKIIEGAEFPSWRFEGRGLGTGIFDEEDEETVPAGFALDQNYPNPFNASTTISFEAQSSGIAQFEVFNILGQRVYAEDVTVQSPGRQRITWDAESQTGTDLPSGLYFYRVTLDGQSQTKKMVLLK